MSLKTKIKQKEAQIGVIGLGYVGLPLAGKFIMMFCMLLGRLEIFAVLVLFTKTYWRT